MADIWNSVRRRFYRLIDRRSKHIAIILIVLSVMLHGMLAEHTVEAWHSIEHADFSAPADWHLILVIFVAGALFAAVTSWLWKLRGLVLHSSAKVAPSIGAGPADGALIILLSNSGITDFIRTKHAKACIEAIALFEKIDLVQLGKAAWDAPLDTVTKPYPFGDSSPFTFWNWQQPLRIIASEMGRSNAKMPVLEIIVVATEDGVDHAGATVRGSKHDFANFKLLIDALFKNWPDGRAPNVTIAEKLLTIGNYEQCYSACRSAIVRARQSVGDERTICFDITGGVVESSVIAAIATLNQKVRFSYVNTNSGIPLFYDASVSLMSEEE